MSWPSSGPQRKPPDVTLTQLVVNGGRVSQCSPWTQLTVCVCVCVHGGGGHTVQIDAVVSVSHTHTYL